MEVTEQLEGINGVQTAIVDTIDNNQGKRTGLMALAVLLQKTALRISEAARLGDFQHAVLTTESYRGLILTHGSYLAGLVLAPDASPLIVSKQARAILVEM